MSQTRHPLSAEKVVQKVHFDEISAENASLKARLKSVTEELRDTREICKKSHKGRKNTVPSMEALVQTSTINSTHTSTQTVDDSVPGRLQNQEEVRILKAEVLRSHAEAATLQHTVQLLRQDESQEAVRAADSSRQQSLSKIDSLSEALRRANELISEKDEELENLSTKLQRSLEDYQRMVNRTEGISMLSRGAETDEKVVDVGFPETQQAQGSGASPAQEMHTNAVLHVLQMTKEELRRKTLELDELRQQKSAPPLAPSLKVDVGTTADTLYPYEKVFREFGIEFTPDAVRAALRERFDPKPPSSLSFHSFAQTAPMESVIDLKGEVDQARSQLAESHQQIDDLSFALELERRNKSGTCQACVQNGAEKSKTAAEVRFLCDSLMAARQEVESLTTRLAESEHERETARRSFDELRGRSEQLLLGCRNMAETSRADAESAIASMSSAVQQKSDELMESRNIITQLRRQLDTGKQKRELLQKEFDAYRQKQLAVSNSYTRLRDESHRHEAELSSLRNLNDALQKDSEKLKAKIAALESQPRASERKGTPPAAQRSRSPHSTLEALEEELKQKDQKEAAHATPSAAQAAGPAKKRPSDYDELKKCFVQLSSLFPKASTPKEISDSVLQTVERLSQEKIASERELKKKKVGLQTMRKELTQAQTTIQDLRKKVASVEVLEKKLESQTRILDKTKRSLAVSRGDVVGRVSTAEKEASETKRQLDEARAELEQLHHELGEGKSLMLSLLGVDSAENSETTTPRQVTPRQTN